MYICIYVYAYMDIYIYIYIYIYVQQLPSNEAKRIKCALGSPGPPLGPPPAQSLKGK